MEIKQKKLTSKLAKLQTLFDFPKVLSTPIDILSVAKYYKVNALSYTLFHNKGFIHMGISRNGKHRKDDLLEQVKLIEKYINRNTTQVLELATGRGANSIYLAKKYPSIRFSGIDLPKGQIQYAYKNKKNLINFVPTEGDFHDLSRYSENTFDLVFVVEALCHSSNKKKVIQEVKRVLKKRGIFIIIDGFVAKEPSRLTSNEKLAVKLIEKGMSVAKFENYKKFYELLSKNGFKIIFEEDDSLAILPSLMRFEKQAEKLLSMPIIISKSIVKIFPYEFTYNAISGYLLPITIQDSIVSYMVVVAQK